MSPGKQISDVEATGEAQAFEATVVSATLDAPIEPGKNVVWCASFLAAWKRLQHDLVKEPVRLDGAEALVEALNNAPDPAEDIPEEWLYAAAGLTEEGIVERIVDELAERFPDKKPPNLAGADGLVAYAYLTAALDFPVPYFQNDEPLIFTDGSGRKTPVSSFGIREHDGPHWPLRMQVAVLFETRPARGPMDFAIDLYRDSEPVQLVVAAINPKQTLLATFQDVQQRTDAYYESHKDELAGYSQEFQPAKARFFGGEDVLLVPDMRWKLKREYSELSGRTLLNDDQGHLGIDRAKQDIDFRLDRSGAHLESEAEIVSLGLNSHCVLNRPFLLYMKLRQSERPFLAMWIDNAELLKPFSAEEAAVAQPAPDSQKGADK